MKRTERTGIEPPEEMNTVDADSRNVAQDVVARLGELGYLVRPRRSDDRSASSFDTGALFLVDGPGLNGYPMTACEVSDFANGQNVRRQTDEACPRCGAVIEERVEWLTRLRSWDNHLWRFRRCTVCSWSIRP